MIQLTRFGGDAFILNAALVRTVESRPDTYVTLTTGERLIVKESSEEVVARCLAWQRASRAAA